MNTACATCGYSLVGLPEHHPCPECGSLYDPQVLRREVRTITEQSMIGVAMRLWQFWRPLPVGWWWVLDSAADLKVARQRVRRWRFTVFGLLLLFVFGNTASQITVDWYQHPPNDPTLRVMLVEDAPIYAEDYIWNRELKVGWILEKERHWNIQPDWGKHLVYDGIYLLMLLTVTWTIMRWTWLEPWLRHHDRKHQTPRRTSLNCAAHYANAPWLLATLVAVIVLSTEKLLLFVGVSHDTFRSITAVVYALYIILIGFVWISSIRADRGGLVFANKSLAIVTAVLVSGPLATAVVGLLMWVF